jgi:hypothetical protein
VGVKDRLPVFKLYRAVDTQMTGKKQEQLKALLSDLVKLRAQGLEPEHDGLRYL